MNLNLGQTSFSLCLLKLKSWSFQRERNYQHLTEKSVLIISSCPFINCMNLASYLITLSVSKMGITRATGQSYAKRHQAKRQEDLNSAYTPPTKPCTCRAACVHISYHVLISQRLNSLQWFLFSYLVPDQQRDFTEKYSEIYVLAL